MSKAPLTVRVIDRLIAWRYALLAIGVLLAAVSFAPSQRLEFDQSIENMFAPGDPLLVPYQQLKRTFGGNEVALAAYVDPTVLTPAGIERLRVLTERLAEVPGVEGVQSLAKTPVGSEIANPENRLAKQLVELFEGYTISADRQVAAVVCLLKPKDEAKATRGETIDQLRAIIHEYREGMLAGEPVMIVDGFRHLEADGRLLLSLSLGLLMLTILACFRSLRWVLVPVAVVQLTVWMTKALLVVLDLRLSMVSSMMSAIITVVGVATVMHIIITYREERSDRHRPTEALRRTGIVLAIPIISAVVTDTVGCSALLLARVGPVQDFGMMNGIGLTLVLASVMLLVPGLVLLGRFDRDPKRTWGEGYLDTELHRSIDWVERRPWWFAALTVAIAIFAVTGSRRLEVETDFTANFREGSPLVASYEFLESRLGGAGVWDLYVPAPEELDAGFLARVMRLEERLRREVLVTSEAGDREPGLTKVFSLADAVATVSPVSLETLERMPAALMRSAFTTMQAWMPETMRTLHASDPDTGDFYFRILLRSKEQQPADQKKHLIAEVERIGREEFPVNEHSSPAQVTGFFVLLTNLIDSLLRDQWLTFAVATVGMWLVMVVVFRSLLLATLGLVPNMLPVFFMTGLLGWLGIKLNMGAAVIAAFSMGLSVDSSVHYIVDFQRARRQGLSLHAALDASQQSAGRAAFFATLALVVGFSALVFSEFVPTIYFGALTSLTMLGGLAGNLIVLPMLLSLVIRDKKSPNGALNR